MKKITFFIFSFLLCGLSTSLAQHSFAAQGPVEVANGTPVTLSINDMANGASVPAGLYDSFSVSADWSELAGGPYSAEADLTLTTTAGSVSIDPPTSGQAFDSVDTTLIFAGDLSGVYDPSTDGFLEIVLNQSWNGSSAEWSNIVVTLFEVPACPEPTALIATNITVNSVDLGWTLGAAETLWNIEVVDVTAGGTVTGTPTNTGVTNPYTLTGLAANNEYEFYVQADCGTDGTSIWVGPFAFRTACEAITPDYTADMSVNVPDTCWDEAGSGDLTTGPMDLGASDWRQGTSYSIGPSNAINLYSNNDSEWLISPTFDLSVGGPFQLEVNVAVTNWNSSTVPDSMGSDDEVQLLMTTDNGATWTNITTWNTANEPPVDGVEYIEDLSAITGNVMFAIWATDGAVDDTEDYDFHVGKFRVRSIPSCIEPLNLIATATGIDTADITWDAGDSETEWTYEYGVSPYTQGGGTTGTVMTTPALSLTGLTAGETYDFIVQANCGGGNDSVFISTTWTQPISGTTCETAIEVASLPYNTSDDTANYGDDYSGSAGATGCGTTSSYLNGDDVVYAYTATADGTINVAMSEIGSTWSGVFVYTDCANIGTECVAGQGNGSSTADYDFDVSVTNGTTYYVVISTFASPQSTTYTLDITEVLCADPSDLMASNITATSADLGWTENGTATIWNIELGEAGFTPTGTATAVSTTNPYSVTGLSAATEYEFYIQVDCGDTQSAWVGPVAFTTSCLPFTPDYNADMSVNVPVCWEEANNGDATTGPMDLGSGLWYASNHNGTPSNAINLYAAVRSDWIISPEFDLSAAAPSELKVYVALTENGTNGSGADLGSDDSVDLLMTTDGGTTWTSMQSWTQGNVPTDVGEEITYDLSAITGTVQFAFLGDEGEVNDTEDVYFHVSKFQVRETPSCIEPSNFMVTNTTQTSADLSWTPGGPETLWDIELVDITASGTATGTPTTSGVTNPYTLTGLTADNDYEVYVRADCTGGDYSPWVGPIAFRTGYCIPVGTSTATYIDNFSTTGGAMNISNLGSGLATDNYIDNSATMAVSAAPDTSFDFEATIVSGTAGFAVWVDWNNDLTFEVSEVAFSTTSYGNGPFIGTVSVPLGTADGDYRMRIMLDWNDSNPGDDEPCSFGSASTPRGEVEDYTVTVDASLSTSDFENEAAFKYYPNPVKNTLTLNAQNSIEQVTMYNMLGQEVLKVTPNAVDSELDMSNLQTGTYFVKVTIANTTETIRVIKQ